MKESIILGISCYYHDSAACLVKNGEIIAASSEERFTRIKGDNSFPHHAINFCLNEANISIEEVDDIVYYENPIKKFSRVMMSTHLNAPKGWLSYIYAMPKWINSKLWLESKIKSELGISKKKEILFLEHHLSHAASAFFPSPFKEANILTIDGVGEWATTTIGYGKGNSIKINQEMLYPDSLGLLYSAFTYYTGFKINSGEYKLMGLAPYGKPIYADIIKKELVQIFEDGSIKLNQKYFNYLTGLTMTNKKFNELFGGKPRKPESKITQKEMNIAASIQQIFNEILLKLANYTYQQNQCENLVLAGGVALNVTAIGYIKKHGPYKNIWIQPASSDAGGALGAALYVWYQKTNSTRTINPEDSMQGAFLGLPIKNEDKDIDNLLQDNGAKFEYFNEETLIEKVVDDINSEKVIGMARGKAEFGPRALGHRSILADARSATMQKKLNLKIKYRESFRPFAPMVLAEDASKYFSMNDESPYMLSTYDVVEKRRKKYNEKLEGLDLLNEIRSDIPAVTHIDYSARVQTVDKDRNPFMYKVLKEFKEKSGCSVIVNTSFNVRGEPIVNNELDAYRCFMETDMDALVIGNRYFQKEEQNQELYQKNNKKRRKYKLD